MTEHQVKQSQRLASIDRFRGIAVFCMIFFQLLNHFGSFGVLTKISEHSIADGIQIFQFTTIADLIAPMFMFAIALSYQLSFNKRVELYGKKAAVKHFVLRNLALIGIGGAFSGINLVIDILNGSTIMFTDYFFLIALGVVICASLLALIFQIKPLKKHKKLFKDLFLYSLSFLGAVVALLASYETTRLVFDINFNKAGYWMVLQSIGMAGLIALPFMFLKTKYKAIATNAMFLAYFLLFRLTGLGAVIKADTQGGVLGAFGWAFIIVMGTIFMEFYSKNKKQALLALLGFWALALTLYFTVGVSNLKTGVKPEPVYVLMTLCISASGFMIVNLFNFYSSKFAPLAWWGRHPLLMYVLEFFLIGSYTMLAPENLVGSAPLWLAILTAAAFITIFTFIAFALSRKNKTVKL
ncbi:MAG: hypothetical protein ACOX6H_03835 [Christensenellales bacterium]|jgi:hypothetical protein